LTFHRTLIRDRESSMLKTRVKCFLRPGDQ
jgi:hypothetical protein